MVCVSSVSVQEDKQTQVRSSTATQVLIAYTALECDFQSQA